MGIQRTWRRAGVLIALSLVMAAATALAANAKADEPSQSFANLLNPGTESWLGLVVKDTNEATTKELKLPHITGVLVMSVIAGSPGEKAGFKPNDVILEFDGQRVRSAAQLRRLIQETPPDRTISVQISRQGKLQTLEAKVQNRGPNALLEQPVDPNYKIWIGPEFEVPATPEQPEGVLVSRVDPDSAASEAGLKAGDVIVRVGSQQIGSMAELHWALQTHANTQHTVTLGIVRDHREREMSVLLAPGRNGVRPQPIMSRKYQ